MRAGFLLNKIHHFDIIGSTNDVARSLIAVGCNSGEVVISDVQTDGRGRKGDRWESPFGGLWFSVILFPYNLLVSKMSIFSIANALAISKGIEEKTGLIPLIKFPNDLYINDKKLCGILIESSSSLSYINWVIVGVGINVNVDIKDLPNCATSIKNELKKEVDKEGIFFSVLGQMEMLYLTLDKLDSFIPEIKERAIEISENALVY
ncbi:TPA: biotin--[acetyl-CoA-carboxylase] ligase [bacterium]|nr:biotin--[acetyl-CoA-carboxylase] ligase [bacterium]